MFRRKDSNNSGCPSPGKGRRCEHPVQELAAPMTLLLGSGALLRASDIPAAHAEGGAEGRLKPDENWSKSA